MEGVKDGGLVKEGEGGEVVTEEVGDVVLELD